MVDWLTRLYFWSVEAFIRADDRKTQRYLDNVTPATCLQDLSAALQKLCTGLDSYINEVFSGACFIDDNGTRLWDQSCMIRHLGLRYGSEHVALQHAPLLWRIFCFAANYPLVSPSGEATIDATAFKRAFALLVLRGFDLFGAQENGWELPWGSSTHRYQDKIPFLNRILYQCLKKTVVDEKHRSREEVEALAAQDVFDTLCFTQPVVTPTRWSTYQPRRETPLEEKFRVAASRLLQQGSHSYSQQLPSKADLQAFVEMLCLVIPDRERWREGLTVHDSLKLQFQQTGDIRYAHLSSSLSNSSSPVFLQLQHEKDLLSWSDFKPWCSDYPNSTIHFFQLWSTIFAPRGQHSVQQHDRALSISNANLLSILKVARFESGREWQYRWNTNELYLQSDLQAAILVAEATASPDELFATLTAKDWFHVLFIRGQDFDTSKDRRLVVLLSPPEFNHEMCHVHDDYVVPQSRVVYVWRTSILQLEPRLARLDRGGLSVHRAEDEETLEFRFHEDEAESKLPAVKINLEEKLVEYLQTEGDTKPSGGAQSQEQFVDTQSLPWDRLRLTQLKCYRLPVLATKFSGPSKRRQRAEWERKTGVKYPHDDM